jgi:hypothetical protein
MAAGTGPFRASVDGDPAEGKSSARADGFSPTRLSLCLLKHHGMKMYGGDEV